MLQSHRPVPGTTTEPGTTQSDLGPEPAVRHARRVAAPTLLTTPSARHARPGRPGPGAVVAMAALPALAVATGLGVVADQQMLEEAAWAGMEERVSLETAAAAADQDFFDQQDRLAAAARYDALVEQALADALAAAEDARTVANASEHAGEDNLAALLAATASLDDLASKIGNGVSLADLRGSQQQVQSGSQTVTQAETAWQEQEAERQRLAAEEAARQAAQNQQSGSGNSSSGQRPSTGGGQTTTGGGSSSGGGTSTGTTWAAGVQSYGVSGLGSALNQRRAAAGLNTLSVQSSTSLANHAAEMAAAGRIWHSGRDHIVGWVDPASADYMIQAYMDSPSHRAWILKSGVSTVSIGAVTINGVLYTAMVFS